MQAFINNFEAILRNNPDVAGTSFMLDPSDAGRLGTLGAEDYYLLTVSMVGENNPAYAGMEIVRADIVNTITGELTVQRGWEGTIAGNWSATTTQLTATVTMRTLIDLQSGPVAVTTLNVAAYNLTLADQASLLRSVYTLAPVQITLPSNTTEDLPTGYRVDFTQSSNQAIQFSSEGADVIESTAGTTPSSNGQGATVSVTKVEVNGADSTWLINGDIV